VTAVPDKRVSVVIPCHSDERRARLVAAVESVLAQRPAPAEVVVSVDHNDSLREFAAGALPGVAAAQLVGAAPGQRLTVLANRYDRGVSGNRNTGVQHTTTPLVALLDDDACAAAGWLAGLTAPFDDPAVVGTGGTIVPDWESPRPAWFPDEFLWAVGGSYPGLPDVPAPVRNVWSASMAVRREAFDAVGGFRVGFGKLGDRARPEDTDLCLRMSKATGGHWVFVPGARISHPVPTSRTTLRFFLARCFNEGKGKIELGRLNDGRDSLGSERDYLSRTLPRAVTRGLADAARGRGLAHAARAAVVVAGAAAAGAGGVAELLRPRRAVTLPAPDSSADVVSAGEPV
jgi:glucosyl-dolichyl phosphate glucuronosyltransferase